ncbi:hypothetical protein GQ44DRAFT_38974 [Phaeosphaeriaceae sp. PMI808]|nr:hypothetical protein GQ44DRAFT_38974 [Phaeosphaeriaceae sp. PMI808]
MSRHLKRIVCFAVGRKGNPRLNRMRKRNRRLAERRRNNQTRDSTHINPTPPTKQNTSISYLLCPSLFCPSLFCPSLLCPSLLCPSLPFPPPFPSNTTKHHNPSPRPSLINKTKRTPSTYPPPCPLLRISTWKQPSAIPFVLAALESKVYISAASAVRNMRNVFFFCFGTLCAMVARN